MSADTFTELSRHYGHKIAVVQYESESGEPVNVAIECDNCNEVLLDYEREGEDEHANN
jgi:hypothetical protein